MLLIQYTFYTGAIRQGRNLTGVHLMPIRVHGTEDRIVSSMQHEKYVAPAFNDGGITGSKIALFGCKPEEVLDVIEEIELAEGLPHPLLDGEWAKRSKRAVSAYLIQDFTPENYRKAIELTKKAGLKYLISWGTI